MNRRGFLGAVLAAPAIVRAEWLMPVRQIWTPPFTRSTKAWTYGSGGIIIQVHGTDWRGTLKNVEIWDRQLSADDLTRLTRPADIIRY